MVKSLLLVFLIIFAVAGVCEFVYIIRLMFYFPNVHMKNYAFFTLKKGYSIRQLNFIWQKIRWHGDAFAVGIIAITDDIDNKELLDCENFIKDKNIILCASKLLSDCTHTIGA